jgi:hypothetical protein
MFGYAKGDLLGKKINILMPSPYSEQHDAYLHRYDLTRKGRLLGTCRGKDFLGLTMILSFSLHSICFFVPLFVLFSLLLLRSHLHFLSLVVEGKRQTGEIFSLRLSLSKIETEEEGIIWVSLFDPVKDNQIVLTLDPDGEFIVAVSGHPEAFGHR